MNRRPNVVYIFADQWRRQATGFAGNPDVQTPHLDRLASESVEFENALSGVPVCCPARASLLTGRRPLRHGVFLNDVVLPLTERTLNTDFKESGYVTGYIGKWHLDGHGRKLPIPPGRQRGFDFWKACECSHDYNHSPFFEGADPAPRLWPGYDAEAQTAEAGRWINEQARRGTPFFLMLSWGPPHEPYGTAPERFRRLYNPASLTLPPNVPPELEADAREWLAGYYAHCSALDECTGSLRRTLRESGCAENTILVFTSDHGDMLGSHGREFKQWPYEESIRVPFLLHWPEGRGRERATRSDLLDAIDHLPTLLDLCGIPVPPGIDGRSFAPAVRDANSELIAQEALLSCPHPFGQFSRERGGREFRGLRTLTHTYVETREGPWHLFDHSTDPFQLNDLVTDPVHATLRESLHRCLHAQLAATGDAFEPGMNYVTRFGYKVDETGTVPYHD